MSVTEQWVLAERESNAGPSLVRIRRLGPAFKFKAYRDRMSVIWTFQDECTAGAPSKNESDFMERFEGRLCESLEPRSQAFLAMVFTESGFREYVFYSREVKRFLAAVNKIPEEAESYPIEIRHEQDESGEFYQSYAQRLLGDA